MILTTPYIDLRTAPMPQYVPLYKSLLSWAPHLGLDLDAVYLYTITSKATRPTDIP